MSSGEQVLKLSKDIKVLPVESLKNSQMNTNKIGSFAISTIDFEAWSNELIVDVKGNKRKPRQAKEIVNKIFADCIPMISDPFWLEKFNLAATGKFPRGFSFHDNLLIYKRGTRIYSIEVPSTPLEATSACIDFFHTSGNIFSPKDQEKAQELQFELTHKSLVLEPLTWGTCNEKMKGSLICNFMSDMKLLMHLSEEEAIDLYQLIRAGVVNKYFGKENITVVNNRIQSIAGLFWNAETRKFYIDPNLKPNITRSYARPKEVVIDSSHKDMVPHFYEKWIKYLESLNKRMVTSNRQITITHVNPQIKRLRIVNADSTAMTDQKEISQTPISRIIINNSQSTNSREFATDNE